MTEAKQFDSIQEDEFLSPPHRKERGMMNICNTRIRCTFEEFEAMPKEPGINYEFIDGIVLMSPRPSVTHQKISLRLATQFLQLLNDKNCDVIQEIDLLLEENILIPDLMIVCNDKFEGKRHEKPPLIVIEIISPSTASRDCVVKLNKYRQLGITEYWIVSPEEKCIQLIHFPSSYQKEFCTGQITSIALPELSLDLEKIFEHL